MSTDIFINETHRMAVAEFTAARSALDSLEKSLLGRQAQVDAHSKLSGEVSNKIGTHEASLAQLEKEMSVYLNVNEELSKCEDARSKNNACLSKLAEEIEKLESMLKEAKLRQQKTIDDDSTLEQTMNRLKIDADRRDELTEQKKTHTGELFELRKQETSMKTDILEWLGLIEEEKRVYETTKKVHDSKLETIKLAEEVTMQYKKAMERVFSGASPSSVSSASFDAVSPKRQSSGEDTLDFLSPLKRGKTVRKEEVQIIENDKDDDEDDVMCEKLVSLGVSEHDAWLMSREERIQKIQELAQPAKQLYQDMDVLKAEVEEDDEAVTVAKPSSSSKDIPRSVSTCSSTQGMTREFGEMKVTSSPPYSHPAVPDTPPSSFQESSTPPFSPHYSPAEDAIFGEDDTFHDAFGHEEEDVTMAIDGVDEEESRYIAAVVASELSPLSVPAPKPRGKTLADAAPSEPSSRFLSPMPTKYTRGEWLVGKSEDMTKVFYGFTHGEKEGTTEVYISHNETLHGLRNIGASSELVHPNQKIRPVTKTVKTKVRDPRAQKKCIFCKGEFFVGKDGGQELVSYVCYKNEKTRCNTHLCHVVCGAYWASTFDGDCKECPNCAKSVQRKLAKSIQINGSGDDQSNED